MRFTLSQIEAFARVVEQGSFHGAARQLNLSQPAVTQRVKELESALDAPLFLRHGPRISLTPAGQALVDYSKRLLGTAHELEQRFRGDDPLRGHLRLGVTNTFALTCLNELLRRLEERYPLLKASVRVCDSQTMTRMLDDEQLDVGVVVEPHVTARIREVPVGHNELVWGASAQVRLPRLRRPADFRDLHLMLTPPPTNLYEKVMAWFSAAGVAPNRVSTCDSFAVVMDAIRSGLAVGVLPLAVLEREIAKGHVRRLSVSPAIEALRVSICYQTATLGPGVEGVAALERELMVEHRLYNCSLVDAGAAQAA